MPAYQDLDHQELLAEQEALLAEYQLFLGRGLALNMSRGKPAPDQLDLSLGMLESLPSDMRPLDSSGEDTRNYGQLLGIPEARQMMAELLGVPAENTLVGGSSSLNLMYDTVARGVLFGLKGSPPQRASQPGLAGQADPSSQPGASSQPSPSSPLKFLCPVPGYDRHFAVSAALGFENIPVQMTADGPDMDTVVQLVEGEPAVKGIWCVPKYSNPTGVTYTDAVVRRFAALRPAAPDFRIYWDNAYQVHDLDPDDGDKLLDLKAASEDAGNPDIWYMFASTSKISFAGGGISALATSVGNLAEIEAQMGVQTIGADKVNQLRHVRWFESLSGPGGNAIDGIKAQMRRLAAHLAPKFAIVDTVLAERLGGSGIASWVKPRGGYFISLDCMPHTAKRTVELALACGVVLTDAGATWPGGADPLDSNIRIAPSYPAVDELKTASELLALCLRLAALERLLA